MTQASTLDDLVARTDDRGGPVVPYSYIARAAEAVGLLPPAIEIA